MKDLTTFNPSSNPEKKHNLKPFGRKLIRGAADALEEGRGQFNFHAAAAFFDTMDLLDASNH